MPGQTLLPLAAFYQSPDGQIDNTKLNFILGQSAGAEIQVKPLCSCLW